MKYLIAIPARFGSSRFPGKPLEKIAGKEMLLRVWEVATQAADKFPDVSCAVGTEDQRIYDFCVKNNIKCFITSEYCRTGTDRCREIAQKIDFEPEFVLNLQGDNPLCPPWFIESVLESYINNKECDVVTPCVNLSWEALDKLRESKKTTPFSGTTAILDQKSNNAIWFSKNIIPAIRKEDKLRQELPMSPVMRHIGLYGYTIKALNEIADLPEGYYEPFEGLEQLRFLENGYTIRVAKVDYRGRDGMSGVDSPEDIPRAEKILSKDGEF